MPKILVVDDDPDFVEITRELLEAKGYKVASASDAKEAINIMQQEKPNLVLLDIMMANILDGLSVSWEMHKTPELYNIPIIVVSSIAESSYAGQFPTDEYLHVDDWISKPVDPELLMEKVTLYLHRSKNQHL